MKLLATIFLCALSCVAISDEGTGEILPQQWWPSEWGGQDELGAMNRLGTHKVLEATALISRGRVFDLSRTLDEDIPLFDLTPGRRKYTLSIPGAPTWGPMGENKLAWNEDYISGHLSQDGTQFDSLAHMATELGKPGDLNELRYYNGFRHSAIATSRGFRRLGVEKITVEDLLRALESQGMSVDDIKPGDALFYHTGWGALWGKDNAKFNSGTPGLSIEAGDWVVERKVVMVGTDNWAVEAIPSPDPRWFAPNHQKFLVENGIYIMENLDFSQLLKAKVHEFAFIFAAVPMRGATGSPARPIAVK